MDSLNRKQAPAVAKAHVVFLVNFLSPNLVPVFQEVQKRVGKLTILVSVPIEENRHFTIDYGSLNVVVQQTKTVKQLVQHPGGFEEVLYVHIPLDTHSHLKRLKPDCVVSLEMGSRSISSALYRILRNRSSRHVLAVYGSERSEQSRGFVRRLARRILLKLPDCITFNGPSCERYLRSMGAAPTRMMPWNYACDPSKAYRETLTPKSNSELRLVTVGQLINRKGTMPAARSLCEYAKSRPNITIRWTILGSGPLESSLQKVSFPSNLQIELLGNQNPDQLRDAYRDHECMLFPTLGDEWGLVVDEALFSGLVVIGSIHSQAMEVLVQNGRNGWTYDPADSNTLHSALDQWSSLGQDDRLAMREFARISVSQRTPNASACQFVEAVERAISK